MKKSKVLLLIIAIVMATLAAGCGDDDSKKSSSTDKKAGDAAKAGSGISVMYEDNFKPYSYNEGADAKGINVDILKEAFKRAGLEVKFSTAPWKRVQQMVEDGQIDAFCSPYKTAEREARFLFPTEYISKEETVFAVKKDSAIEFSGDLSKMSQYTIGYFKGYPPLTKDENVLKSLKIDELDSNTQALEKLLSGRVDMVANDKLTLMASLKEMGKLNEVKFLSTPIKSDNAYIAYSKKKDMKDIAAKIDKAIAEMRADGTVQKIIDKYTK